METSWDFGSLIECCTEDVEKGIMIVINVCSLCFRQYDLEEDLRGHMKEYHKCEPSNRQTFAIVNDDKADIKIPLIRLSAAAQAPDLRPLPFNDFRLILRAKMTLSCSDTFPCASKFENLHKLEMHAKCHKDAPNAQFKCFECGLELANWRRCSVHLWKAHQLDVDLLHCPICSFKSHASVLWRHMRLHKKWRPRVLNSLHSVQKRLEHKRKHLELDDSTANPPLTVPKKNKYYAEKTCVICNRKFVNGKTLSKHVKTVHNKIKPFICNVCGRKTARKASLTIHMRQHTGEKPLQCKTSNCKFSTRDPSVLYKHQLRHEKVGKLKCSFCDYECIQTISYKRHLRLNHPDEYKKIACDQCNYVTINEQKLNLHKEDHCKGLIVNCEDSMDATRSGGFKYPRKLHDKNSEISADCFLPLESIDSLPHEPAVDTGGVTIPAPSEDTQFPTYLNS